jgi:D-glycero-D-manno-heptose 1,7-bisphosphate phosphatase
VTAGRVAVFLDRDGTINEEVDFLRTPEQLRLIPGAGAAIRELNERGILACIISNQSGVARGFITEEDLVPIHARLSEELRKAGAAVDRIDYCPHHPTEGKPPYDVVCGCRKPATGMLTRAAAALDIDLGRSFVIGDRIVDIQVGQAVGARTVLVLTGYGPRSVEECRLQGVVPDSVFPSLREAIAFILTEVTRDTFSRS